MREPFADNLAQTGGLFVASAARRQAETIVAAQASADPWTARHRVMDGPEPLIARASGEVHTFAAPDIDLCIAASQSVSRSLGTLAQTIREMP